MTRVSKKIFFSERHVSTFVSIPTEFFTLYIIVFVDLPYILLYLLLTEWMSVHQRLPRVYIYILYTLHFMDCLIYRNSYFGIFGGSMFRLLAVMCEQ